MVSKGYYNRLIAYPDYERDPEWMTLSRYWLDFAQAGVSEGKDKEEFLSPWFIDDVYELNDALLILATLDLPLRAEPWQKEENDVDGVETGKAGNLLQYKSDGPTIVFAESIQVDEANETSTLLAQQVHFPTKQPYKDGDKSLGLDLVNDSFAVGEPYTTRIVLSNPSERRQEVDVLSQIPLGALVLEDDSATTLQSVDVQAYQSRQIDVTWYYPLPVTKSMQLGVQVSQHGNNVIAKASQPVSAKVMAEQVDEWEEIVKFGSLEQVMQLLQREDLINQNMSDLAWRCKRGTCLSQNYSGLE